MKYYCPICNIDFTPHRKEQNCCGRICANKYRLLHLKESSGFKLIEIGALVKGKRIVIAECPFCLNPFKSTLQSLIRTTQCGCLYYYPGINPRLIRIRGNMIQRCHNPKNTNYCRYGARGISVCDEWRKPDSSFFKWALANGYSDDLSIDRINNDGNYEPFNCRWATRKEQMANTRIALKNVSKNPYD